MRSGWEEFFCIIGCMACILMVVITVIGAISYAVRDYPNLVGYDCEGTHGPIYAEEEDHFPRCRKIELN